MCILRGRVTESSLSRSDLQVLWMATKTLKPDKEAITKILVADTDSESGAEVSDVEEEQQQQEKQLIQQASAQDKLQAATSGRWLPP